MSISVVVPVYNEEKYIGSCLNSLKKQKEKPDEIIIVDNNCTDNTINIAKRFNVKIIKEKKQGIIPARNAGFNKAKGEIIARIDADSVVPSNWIKKIKQDFSLEKIAALTGPVISYDLPFRSAFYANLYLAVMRKLQKGGNTLVGPNMAISREIWQKVKGNVCQDDKKVHEDVDLALHILKAGGKIAVDYDLVMEISGRRIKHTPLSFFFEYPIRVAKTLKNHSL